MSGVDSQHLGEVEFVTHRLQGCCCDQDHRSSFTSSSSTSSSSTSSTSSTSSRGASNSSSDPPPTSTVRKAKNLEAFLGLRDSGPGSSSREAAERAALGSLQYQQSLWGEGGGGKKNLGGLLGVSEPSPPPPKPGFSLPHFLEATRRALERRGSPGRLGGLRGVLSPKERWKRAGEKCHSLPRRMARWSSHNNNNNSSSSGGNHNHNNSNRECSVIPEKPQALERQAQLGRHPIFMLARDPSPPHSQPSPSSSTAASPNPSPIPPRLRRLGRRELPPPYTPPPPGTSRQGSPGTSRYHQCPSSSPHPPLPKDLPLIPFPSPSPAFPRPPSSLPTRLTTNLVATTSKSLDNIIAEARRELAEERSCTSSAMTTSSAESLYTTMVRPLASSSSAPSGYPSYLVEPKTDHPDYLDMDRLTSFVTASLK